ncbi:MarR family winged helix-turn-helix transcriptional regulator [Altererythrobacter sp. MF3-039]|uniref:MarR family winged helix-turn-helix transcriptional regulator n=1 Tax=Altererythrobacter sp. MF3-039 TaxID=3252901 RepID=UPI00390C7C47
MDELLNPSNCLCSNLRRSARKLTRIYDAALGRVGINVGQFATLATLAAMGETTISELAEALELERTALTRNLSVLERNGLVSSRAGEDRRERRISLSAQGSKSFADAVPLWERAQSYAIDAMGARNASALLDQMNKLA